MESGEFREDLYYRLKVVTLAMPSLAERREDAVRWRVLDRTVAETKGLNQEVPPEEMDLTIRNLGRTPRQRTTLYDDAPAERQRQIAQRLIRRVEFLERRLNRVKLELHRHLILI